MFTPQWAQDARAKLFKCTGVLSGHLTCQMVLQSAVVCLPPGAPICPGMITIPSPGLCTPVSYGYRTVRRVSGWWIADGIGTFVISGGNTKVWASQTGDAGTWIDITGNLELLGGACNKFVQPREFTEFNGEICLTVSKLNGRLYNFFYYDTARIDVQVDGRTCGRNSPVDQ